MSKINIGQEGFTVVELIVTLIVGAIFVVAMNAMFTTQSYISAREKDTVLANAYAEAKFESLRSAGFLALTNGTTSVTSELPTELKSPHSGSLVISSYNDSVKKADLTITYNEQGTSRSLTYTSYIGELGVGQY